MNSRYLSTGFILGLLALAAASCGSGSSDSGDVGGAFSSSATGGHGLGGYGSSSGGSSSGGSNSGGSATDSTTGGSSIGGSAIGSGTGGSSSGGSSVGGNSTGLTTGGGGQINPSAGGSGTVATGGAAAAAGGSEATGGAGEQNPGGTGGLGAGASGIGGTNPGGNGGSGLGTGGGSETGGSGPVTCSINVTANSLSTEIPTVGIVEWSTDLAGLTEAQIEFGLDTGYGMTAPVDLGETDYRTLLLGMKAGGRTYHFRVVAKAGAQICTGEDNTLPPTGDPPNSLPQLTLTPAQADGLDGGFLVLETFKQAFGAAGDGAAYIIDKDGDFVWWYVVRGFVDLSRARQSYDGKYMWITTVNVMSNTQKMLRVKMDGSDVQDLTQEFGSTHHDFAVHADGTVAFMTYGANSCDDIKERAPDGTVTTIINSGAAIGTSPCHSNVIVYDRNDDTIVFSELDTSSIVKVSRDTGQVIWLMSSQNSANATVSGISWVNQHGIHIIDEDHLLFFNNGSGPNSTAIEAQLSINGGSGTATQAWSYPSSVTVQYMGDVQRLDNGNTLVTYSSAGEIREVSPSGTVLQTINVSGSGSLFGFSEKRRSLYGPPPR